MQQWWRWRAEMVLDGQWLPLTTTKVDAELPMGDLTELVVRRPFNHFCIVHSGRQ